MEELIGVLFSETHWGVKVTVALGVLWPVVGAITAVTPTRIDDKVFGTVSAVYNPVMKILNVVSLNVGKARNMDDAIPDREIADEIRKAASTLGVDGLRDRLRDSGPD